MRIAQIAPLYESIPPKLYGGTERVVSFLTEELVRRGHEVTLFASADSTTSAQLVSHPSFPSVRAINERNETISMFHEMGIQWIFDQVRLKANEFDILHFHTDIHYAIVGPFLERTVATLHGKMGLPSYVPFFNYFNKNPLISISNDQRTHLNAHPNWVGTVYHGIPKDSLPFTENPKGTYLAFLGRTSEEKKPEWAIEIAVRAGIPLKMAAKVSDGPGTALEKRWKNLVKPLVDKHSDLVEYIGEINETEKAEFLGNAIALIFPIDWPEPFGIVMIEAMACGCPVVARPRGSVPEVIDEGVTGLMFESLDEGVAAVKRASKLDRKKIREVFEQRFTSEKMADNYLQMYQKILKH
ncbi:glycosyl transferases group 1 domain-containing protein [Ditylenchus destructor]|uniref:Glycosyl transferases group 1 domain-containing protein n=1 Tax=Ditylenchus destructor TaxID=166010 RepID=A0AAD4MKY9_9BILA|nr:glycosyl transferases group 1 domain-containing protein [Ditylenchus destructor]